MNKKLTENVIIIGGGIVGLTCAALLSQAKIPVTVIEATTNIPEDTSQLTARVSAINPVSQRLLQIVNAWEGLREHSVATLQKLVVWDGLGGAEIDFESAVIGVPTLGFIVENREIIHVLQQQLAANEYVTLIAPTRPIALSQTETQVEIILENQQKIHASLIVGADGGKSWLRQHMLGETLEKSYQQSAIIAVVRTAQSHQHTGWQAFLPAEVLALLPLADPRHCAIVWSVPTVQADELMQKDIAAFNVALNNAFGLRLGEIHCVTEPQAIPLVMRHAKNYVQKRMVLIGDAAHTIHPLAGQGVNLGLLDAACLAQCVLDAKQQQRDIGSLRVLRRYERWRKGDNTQMLLTMRGLKELFNATAPLIVQARNVGLQLTNKINFIKNRLMRIAMGENNDLPQLLKE